MIATGFEHGQQYAPSRSSGRSVTNQPERREEENGARIPEFLRRRQQQTNDES